MNRIVCILIMASVFLSSCEKDEPLVTDNNDMLLGYWSNPVFEDTLCIYERVNGLRENQYTLAFKQEQAFVERKNAGWCGTPPITYANYEGTWTRKDSEIKVSVGYWGGTAQYTWKIISLDNKYLKVYRMKEDYKWENN